MDQALHINKVYSRVVRDLEVPVLGIHLDVRVKLAHVVNAHLVVCDKAGAEVSMCLPAVADVLLHRDPDEKTIRRTDSAEDTLWHSNKLAQCAQVVRCQTVQEHPCPLVEFVSGLDTQ